MDMGTPATDIVAIMDIRDTNIVADIVATMGILMGVIIGEGIIIHTTDLITEAMATHMAAITAGAEDSGSASASKS
jgi:hypothetical protein